jgi:hypothetical protein
MDLGAPFGPVPRGRSIRSLRRPCTGQERIRIERRDTVVEMRCVVGGVSRRPHEPDHLARQDPVTPALAAILLQVRVVVVPAARPEDGDRAPPQGIATPSRHDTLGRAPDRRPAPSEDVDPLVAPSPASGGTPCIDQIGRPDAVHGYRESGRWIRRQKPRLTPGLEERRMQEEPEGEERRSPPDPGRHAQRVGRLQRLPVSARRPATGTRARPPSDPGRSRGGGSSRPPRVR